MLLVGRGITMIYLHGGGFRNGDDDQVQLSVVEHARGQAAGDHFLQGEFMRRHAQLPCQ